MRQRYTVTLVLLTFAMIGCSPSEPETTAQGDAFEDQVAEYIQKFPLSLPKTPSALNVTCDCASRLGPRRL